MAKSGNCLGRKYPNEIFFDTFINKGWSLCWTFCATLRSQKTVAAAPQLVVSLYMYLLQRRNNLRNRCGKPLEFNTLVVVPVFPVQNLQNCPAGKFSQKCSEGSFICANESVKVNLMLLRKQVTSKKNSW